MLWVASQSYFFAEDFLSLQLFQQEGLGREQLTRSIFGHLIPGWILLQQTFSGLFGANWTAATVVIMLFHVLGAIALTRLLVAMQGRRWWHPLFTILFGCSLVMLNTAPWWAATTTIQVACAACISSWGCAVRYWRTGRVRHLLSLALMFGVALSLWEKSMVTCAYLGLFVLLVGLDDGALRQRLTTALRLWPVWLVMAVECLAVLAVYLRGNFINEAGETPGLRPVLEFLGLSLLHGFSPATSGMGYPSPGLFGSSSAAAWASNLVLLALVVWTGKRSARARRAWLWFLAVYVIGQSFVALGRVSVMGPEIAASILRYQLDATYLFLISAAVVITTLSGSRQSRSAQRTKIKPAVVIATLVVLGIVVLPTWAAALRNVVETSPGAAARGYAKNFQETYPKAAAETDGLLDQPVPGSLVQPDLYPWSLGSKVWPMLMEGVQFTRDPTRASVVDESGRVGPAVLTDLHPPQQGGCAQVGQVAQQILSAVRPQGDTMLAMSVNTPTSSKIALTATGHGGADLLGTGETFAVPAGESNLAVHVHVADLDGVKLTVLEGGPVCVSDVRLVTASAGPQP